MNTLVVLVAMVPLFITNSTTPDYLLTDEKSNNERIQDMESNLGILDYDMRILYKFLYTNDLLDLDRRVESNESHIQSLYVNSCACMLIVLLFAWMQCFINCMHRNAPEPTIDAVVINPSEDEGLKTS